jgi:hypothetical protein
MQKLNRLEYAQLVLHVAKDCFGQSVRLKKLSPHLNISPKVLIV